MGMKDRLRDVPVIGTVIAVQERYSSEAGGQFAAAIAFYGFLSLFPLILLGLSVAGFVLAGDAALRAQFTQSMTRAIPGIGEALGTNIDAVVESRAAVGIIGLVALLLSGMRIVDSATVATSRLNRVEPDAGIVAKKLRSLGALAGLGLLAVLGAAAGALVGIDVSGVQVVVSIGGVLLSFGLDVVLFLVAYRVLTAAPGPPWRALVPGALFAGAGWTALKVVGSTFVATRIVGAQAVYGKVLAPVVGALLLLYLAGQLYLYGAALNVVLREDGEDDEDGDDGVDGTHERTEATAGGTGQTVKPTP